MFVNSDFAVTPIRVLSSYRLLSSPIGVVTRQKGRKCWGIALKAGGKTCYTQNGKTFLSDSFHVVILPKGSRYNWTCTEQGECLVVDFDALGDADSITSVEISDSTFFQSTFAKLEKCLLLNDTTSYLEAMQLLYGILLFLAKSAQKKYIPKDKRHILTPAIDHMMEHYADPGINNDSLAALCGISTVYFRKTFEAVYGSSPIRYLHNLRISKAKAILSGDFDSIGQVAESVGYSSVYHFSKMFKTYTGLNPTQFKRSVR